MIKLVLFLVVVAVAAATAAAIYRRRQAAKFQRQRVKEQAYVDRLRAKWDEKHSEPAETFVERRRPWDGVERRRANRTDTPPQ